MKKRWIWLLLAVALMLTACTNKKEVSEPSVNQKDAGNNYNFIFVCPFIDPEYWGPCIEGMNNSDDNLGTYTTVFGPKTMDNFAEILVENMKKAIKKKPDGIITYAGLKEMEPLIEEATKKGIPVLAIDSDAPTSSRIAFVGTDTYNMGYEAGENLIDLCDGDSTVGVLVSTKSAEKEMQVVDAFKDTIQDYNISVSHIAETDANLDVAEKETKKMLKAHPEITAVFCTAGYNAAGAARAKQALGRDDLIILGFDDTKENIQFLREGAINMILVQKIYDAGRQSVNLLKEYLDTGSLSQKTYDVGTIKVTKENVDTYNKTFVALDVAPKVVRVGYYSGDNYFQDGFSDTARKSGYAYEYYQAISKATGWDYQYIYGTRTEMLEKLEKGEIDIMAGLHRSDVLKKKILFSKRDIGLSGIRQYFAVSEKREDLLAELNYAMEQINQTSPDFEFRIYKKYYSGATEQMLNNDEVEWIKKRKAIKIGYIRYNLPLSDQDKDGNPIGLVKELVEHLERSINADVQPVCFENVQQMEEGLAAGKVDTAFPIYSDLWLSENKKFQQTDPIISDRVMIVSNGTYSTDLMSQIAMSQSDIGIQYYLKKTYPDAKVVSYNSREEALDAVLHGKERCAVGGSSIMHHLLSGNLQYKGLNVAYMDTSEDFGMAVRQEDCLLLGILNKTIGQIDDANFTSAMVKYSEAELSYSLRDFIQRNSVVSVLFMTSLLALLTIMFVWYFRRNHLFNIEQEKSQLALEDALEKANSANQAKTNFLSSMSHDIRTPMNAIVGMTTIAQMNLDDREKVNDCLKKIDLSGHHLLTLINNVLDISKIEGGQLQLNPVVFSLESTFHSLIHIVSPQITEKKLEFEYHIPDFENRPVYADEARINQIFVNILTNAVKYTPKKGKILLDVQKETSPEDDVLHLTYTVTDNGIGMSEHFMENMYESFARARDSRVDKIQGTGLGLAIVKQMIEMMEGTIDCISEEGKGTTFIIRLDLPWADALNTAEGEPLEEQEEASDKGEDSSDFMQGRHFLIAEDNDINWEVITGILEMFGVTADRAENGQVCVDKVKNAAPGTYDLILMDVQMPVMNGREATQIIRKDKRDYVKNIPVIAISADAFAEDIEESLQAGMNGHVSKPIDLNVLLQEIKKVL